MTSTPDVARYAVLAGAIFKTWPDAPLQPVLHACMQACIIAGGFRGMIARTSSTSGDYRRTDKWAEKRQAELQAAFDGIDRLPTGAVVVCLDRDDPRGSVGHLRIHLERQGNLIAINGDTWAQGGDRATHWPLFR